MNERQQYEKHLAEKLQQLPPPDDEHRRWEQMRTLLDKEMPRGGGLGNGKPGNGRWWITSIVAVMLMFGTWFTVRNYYSGSKSANKVAKATPNQNAANKETASSSGVSLNKGQGTTGNEQPAANNVVSKVPGNATDNTHATANSANNKSSEENEVNATKNKVKENNELAKANGESLPTARGKPSPNSKNNAIAANTTSNPTIHKNNKNTYPRTIHNNNNLTSTSGNNSRHQHNQPARTISTAAMSLPSHPERAVKPSVVKVNIRYNDRLSPSPASVLGDTVEKSLVALLQKADSLDKATAAAKKPEKKNQDIGFAAGFTLPLVFPLGDQQALGLNYKAGPNTISDYIPAIHFQYHLNGTTYLQADIQALAPQYIQPILLSQAKKEIPYTGTNMVTSYFARKLYYFNLPVTIYHSPLKNFYLGAGLQFSHLISGIALADQRKVWQNGQDSLVSQQYFRFKNDSLSQMITNNEIRLVLDINYYWNRFKVGFRYTQAFGNFVNFRLNSFAPYTIEKNKSLQFYLGFNLWEDKKKKKNNKMSNKPLLTFK